jgi:hypothetical protein
MPLSPCLPVLLFNALALHAALVAAAAVVRSPAAPSAAAAAAALLLARRAAQPFDAPLRSRFLVAA